MSWNNSVYTTLGTAMLSEALAGKGMNFTRAVSGAGTMAAAELSQCNGSDRSAPDACHCKHQENW